MNERKQLSLREPAERAVSEGSRPGARGWEVSAQRLARLKEHARDMRRNPTEAEKLLWSRLKDSQLGGFKFRRQEVVGSAIVDFACPTRWIVVEVDDESYTNPQVDALQDRKLTDVGIRVLRFSGDRVMRELDSVCDAILEELNKPFDRKAAARGAVRPRPDPSAEGQGLEASGFAERT